VQSQPACQFVSTGLHLSASSRHNFAICQTLFAIVNRSRQKSAHKAGRQKINERQCSTKTKFGASGASRKKMEMVNWIVMPLLISHNIQLQDLQTH